MLHGGVHLDAGRKPVSDKPPRHSHEAWQESLNRLTVGILEVNGRGKLPFQMVRDLSHLIETAASNDDSGWAEEFVSQRFICNEIGGFNQKESG